MAALEVGAGRAARRARRRCRRRSAARSKPPPARIRDFHERQLEACGRCWSYRDGDGTPARPEGDADRPRRHLRARRQGGVSVERADERDSGEGRGRRRDRHGGADAGASDGARSRGERNPLVLAAARSPASTACSRSAARRRSARWPTARRRSRAVHKITGPGNAYVASAKRRVFGTVGIDMIAGPSEILVLADGTTPPDWVAMDLFSQAEHDELAQSILLCPDAGYLDRGARGDRAAAAGDAAPRRHPRVARRPRRADPARARWKRPARSATGSRPSTSRSARASRSAGSRC